MDVFFGGFLSEGLMCVTDLRKFKVVYGDISATFRGASADFGGITEALSMVS